MVTTSSPAVLFVEHTRQGAFSQLAAVLRRRGVRTVHVTTARPLWVNRLMGWLAYDRSVFVTDEQLGDPGGVLADEDVRDVQHTEYVLDRLAAGAAALPAGPRAELAHRVALLDKFALGKLCESRGVPVPQKIDAIDATAAQAVAELGLPLVVKAKVGASGLGVRIVSDLAEVQRALDELGPLEGLFYERYIPGDYLDYSAVAGPDGPLQEVGTRTVAAVGTAPPSSLETLDDPELLRVGRQAVQALGLAGFVHLDTVRDAEGRFWVMDVNLRVWGSMSSLHRAGIDFTEGYLALLGLTAERPRVVVGPAGRTVTAFTGVVDAQIDRGSVFGTLGAWARHAPPFIRRLGLRYGASSFLYSVIGLAGRLMEEIG